MAGMRLGYALGSPALIAAMRRYKLGMNANVAVLRAAMASFGDATHVADQRRRMVSTRDVEPVIAAFRQRNMVVGRKFPSMPNWLRITVGTPSEMQAFMTNLRAIVAA